MNILIYIIVFILLFAFEIAYFGIADKYNIIDKPNERSSHSTITLRGGGIIIWFAALIYFALNVSNSYLFFIGITIVGLVSFADDISELPNRIRILAQFVALSLIFFNIGFYEINIFLIIIGYIFAIGIINAYNFMDGINGMTGLYSIVFFLSTWYISSNEIVNSFHVNDNFFIFPILANIVFLFFNFRKRAKCFAGDVGSITTAFWVIYILFLLILKSESLIWILLLVIYGADTVGTIIHRLYLRQNIFKAHRLHFFQKLANEGGVDQRIVSFGYSFVQLILSFIVIWAYKTSSDLVASILVIVTLALIYLLKFTIKSK